jgi:alpha-amylase
VTKRLRAGGERGRPWLDAEVRVVNPGEVAVDLQLGLEWGFNMSGGGGNPAAYYLLRAGDGTDERLAHDSRGDHTGLETLAFGNEYDGVRVDAAFHPAARAVWYPLETISNSEGGYERIYQGSALMLCWPLALAAGDERVFTARFAATEERDRGEE